MPDASRPCAIRVMVALNLDVVKSQGSDALHKDVQTLRAERHNGDGADGARTGIGLIGAAPR